MDGPEPDVLDDLDLDETPFVLSSSERGLDDRDAMSLKATALAESLRRRLGAPVQLTVTDNSSSVLAFHQRAPGEPMDFRLHHMFLDAPENVLDDIAAFVRGGRDKRSASSRLGRFIDSQSDLLRQSDSPARFQRLNPVGKHRNLKDIFDCLNARFFEGRIDASIGWGRLPSRRNRRSIRFGVYVSASRSIRIHPVLDDPSVPDFFVDYVVFHEMLHQAIPVTEKDGRQVIHGRGFREAEERFPDYGRAISWEKANLAKLLARMPLRNRHPGP